MKKTSMYVSVVVVLVVVAAFALRPHAGHEKGKTQDRAPMEQPEAPDTKIPVSVQTVTTQDLVESIEMTGTLKPADEVTVGSRTAGRIAWVIGKEGTPVKRGHVVARMEDDDAQTQVRAAKAALLAAKARLGQAQAAAAQQYTSTDSGIQNADAALQAAIARLNQAKTTADATQATTDAQTKVAEAAVVAAESRLRMLRNGSRTQEKAIAEQNVRVAKATLDNDQRQYERLNRLFDQGAVSKAQLDGAETKLQVSKAQYDASVQQSSLVQTGPREEEIDSAEAAVQQAREGLSTARANEKQVEVAQANVEIAKTGVDQARAALVAAKSARQVNVMRDKDVQAARAGVEQAQEALTGALQTLDYCFIYSPVDGVVSERIAEVGQSVGSNAGVLRISANEALYFEAQVSELEAPRVRNGQRVALSVDALQGNRTNVYAQNTARTISGIVESVVPVVDTRTRNFTVRVVVPRSASLFPGMFARGTLIAARHTGVVAILKDTLVSKGDRQVVMVADGDVARERPVTLGVSDTTRVQVVTGLAAGEQIITTGQQNLKDGDEILVQHTQEHGAQPTP